MWTQQAVLSRAEQAYLRIKFFEKKFKIILLIRVRGRYKSSLVFSLSPICNKFKFKLSVGIKLFGLKTTSHGKPNLKNSFLKSDLPCEVVFRPKVEYLQKA